MNLCSRLAARPATHLPAHVNWSDGRRLLPCLHCRVAEEQREREDGWETELEAGRFWTDESVDRGCSLSEAAGGRSVCLTTLIARSSLWV